MIHPIFLATLRRPDLLATHAANYLALLRTQLSHLGSGFVARAAAWAVAAVGALLFLGLAGIAVMLGVSGQAFHWVLVAVPGAAVVLALAAVFVATRPLVKPEVSAAREELDADLHALQLAGGSKP